MPGRRSGTSPEVVWHGRETSDAPVRKFSNSYERTPTSERDVDVRVMLARQSIIDHLDIDSAEGYESGPDQPECAI